MKRSALSVKAKDKSLIYGYGYVLPALIFMLALIGYPIIYNIYISFLDMTAQSIGQGHSDYIGLQNYITIFQDATMWKALYNTFFFTILCILFQFMIGFGLAVFFSKKFKAARYIKGLLVIGYMMPMTVNALLWKFMLSPSGGIINSIMVSLHLTDQPVEWLMSSETVMWGLVIANTWVGIPFNMLLLSTGLDNIPAEIYESASIDGAKAVQRFIYITVPMIKQSIFSVLLLGFVYTFKVFDLVYVATGGGPVDASEVLSTYSYNLSFKTYYFGQGAAVANVLFVCLFVVALIYLAAIGKDEVN